MTKLDSPEGYKPYKKYSLPLQYWFPVLILLSMSGLIFVLYMEFSLFSENRIQFVAATTMGIAATLYIHESLHYVVDLLFGYEPEFAWPNMVYVPNQHIPSPQSIIALLAPQLLTIALLVPLIYGVDEGLEIALAWGFVTNLGGGSKDISWILRGWTWPEGTRVVVSEDRHNYVSFPKEEEK